MKIRSFFFEMRSWIFSVGLIFANMLYLAESQQCRRCDQIISGRNLAYSRALEIIQEEEYLDEEEFDEIRYKRNLRVKNEFRKKHAKVFERVKRPRTKRQTEIVTGGECPGGWLNAGDLGGCYLFAPNGPGLNWQESVAYCASIGGFLTDILNQETETFLESSGFVESNPDVRWWIGGNDIAQEGRLQWLSGEVFHLNGVDLLFTNWSPGEPNDSTGNEDCIEFEINPATGTCDWNDLPCSLTVSGTRIFRPICKQEQTETPIIEEPDDSDSSSGAAAALEMLLDLLTSSQTQGVVGAAVASMSMMSSMGPMPMTMASGAPPGNAAPGVPGGGAPPSAVGALAPSSQTLATALSLVPLGLTPIAVFPPYNTPRTIPAISVIFSEDPNIRAYKKRRRRKRSLVGRKLRSFIQYLKRNIRRVWRVLFSRARNYAKVSFGTRRRDIQSNRVLLKRAKTYSKTYFTKNRRYLDSTFAKLKYTIHKLIQKLSQTMTVTKIKEKIQQKMDDLHCFQTRLQNHVREKRRRKKNGEFSNPSSYRVLVKREINSMDDCFDFMEEPLYGFRVNVTQEINCSQLGSECGMPSNTTVIDNQVDNQIAESRQTGEAFSSEAPPDCRIVSCR